MDKYQEYIFKTSRSYYGLSVCGKSALEKVIVDDKIIFKQNDDITISDYILYIANIGIKAVFAIVGAKETPLLQQPDPITRGTQNRFYLPISFANKIDAIKIVFNDNLADDLIFKVVYEEADKGKYYAQKEKERMEALTKKAEIKVSTGRDLVNIYFQPCCEEYSRTEIVLYKDNMMLAKYKVDEETFFKSISGLAYGKYQFVMKQYANNNLVLETDKMSFFLSMPDYGGKPTICG